MRITQGSNDVHTTDQSQEGGGRLLALAMALLGSNAPVLVWLVLAGQKVELLPMGLSHAD